MSEFRLTKPVVFIIFNRPNTTERVFREIAKAKPSKLFVISDGPREGHPEEGIIVAKTRKIIEKVDWPCDLKLNFSQSNQGCGKRLHSGLNWVFDEVEQAIILEDDCLPGKDFFRFCEEMLDKYADCDDLGMVNGINVLENQISIAESYYFSKYAHVWGWATWRRVWQKYDFNLSEWPHFKKNNTIDTLFKKKSERRYWTKAFDLTYSRGIDTWDYQLAFTFFKYSLLSITPNRNLISNIGFGPNATHTKMLNRTANMPVDLLSFPLNHPSELRINEDADRITSDLFYDSPSILQLAIRSIHTSALMRATHLIKKLI